MRTDDGTIIPDALYISSLVLISLIILITIYILFLYIKSKEFHTYSCGYVIILIISILLSNIIRIIPVNDNKEKYLWLQKIQAFFLASFDKYILLALTLHVFIIYLGIMKTDFYFNHEKSIFLITFFASLAICFLIGGLFLIEDPTDYGIYYYIKDSSAKKIVDNIFNSIFLTLNTFFCIVIIINICIRKEDIEKGMMNQNNYEHDLNRIIIIFIIYIDFIYLVSCLIINLIYSINKLVINETKKIFCKKLISKQSVKINTIHRSTFYQVEMKNRLSNEIDDDDE